MASSGTPDPGARRRTLGIAVLVISTYLVMTANGGMFLLVVSLKQMAGDFEWPRSVPSLAYAFFFAGTGIGGIAMGYWFDRFGGLVALLVFSALQTAAMLFYAAVDGMLALYIVSALFGIGYGGINICYPVLAREHLPPAEAGRRLGVILLFGTLGMALGGWLAGSIFDSTGAYTPAFLIGATFNVANLIIAFFLIIRTRADRGAPMRPAPA